MMLFCLEEIKMAKKELEKNNPDKRVLGFIKWFDNDRGFGVIESLNNIEYFLHISDFERKPIKVSIGTPFLFIPSESKGRNKATHVVVPETNQDFILGINNLIRNRGVISYVVTIKGESRWGNPYKRKETRDMDTLGIFINKFTDGRGIKLLFELFKECFDESYLKNWTYDDLKQYYSITKKEIKKIDIELSNEELEEKIAKNGDLSLENFFNRKTYNDELISELINYYNSQLNNEDAFDLWHEKIRASRFYGSRKQEVNINEKLIEKYRNKIETESVQKIIKYIDVSDNTYNLLVNPYFEQKIDTYEKLGNSLNIYNNLDDDLKPTYFKLLIKSIDEDLYFQLWKDKKYSIDFERQSFSSFWGFDFDFDLPLELYKDKIEEITINELERIQKLHPNDDDLIEGIIQNIFNIQIVEGDLFKRFIPILEKTRKSFSNSLLENYFQNDNSELAQQQIKNLDVSDLINLFSFFEKSFLYSIILDKLDLNITYYFEKLACCVKFSDDFGLYIVNKLNSDDVSISSTLYYLTYLKKENFEYDISIVTKLFERKPSFENVLKIYEFSLSFSEKGKKIVELLVVSFVKSIIEISGKDYVTLLSIESKLILETTLSLKFKIEKIDNFYIDNFKKEEDGLVFLKSFCSNSISKIVEDELFLEFIQLKLLGNEKYIFDYLILNRVNLLPNLINRLKINDNIVSLCLLLFESKKELIKNCADKFNYDIQVIYSVAVNDKEKLDFDKLNAFFKKHNYRYQILFLKYFISKYYNSLITREEYFFIQNSIQIKQLPALLIAGFVSSEVKNRDELMNLMNLILKEHYILINEIDNNKELFNNIYSISGLVKNCDGRKSYSGIEFWQGGNITRKYTDGNHSIKIGESEHIYCEGRLWKKEGFYDSETNKPLPELHDLFWCRNKKCVGVNDKLELDKAFFDWTLIEINEVFKVGLDRLSFVHLAGWLNRMDTIFNRLNCYECKDLLRPKVYTPKLLGHYGVPLFWCVNNSCKSHHDVIRFTHCRGCKKILDSRECNTCQKCNWLICDNEGCGKCGCGTSHTNIYAEYD